ncbi:MAG: hypothetical protein KGP28_05795 [Bdellovibrionales bacterium]|nr:hypothetical protein [Bdellovibrionales bacterium]
MKKLLCTIMVMSLVSSSAFAGNANQGADHTQMIAKAFDGFRYAMTVQAGTATSQEQAVADFKNQLAKLEAQGVTAAELMNYMRASILDSETLQDFDRLMTTINENGMSAEDASALMMHFMESRYQQGANYSGGGKGGFNPAGIIIGVLIVGAVTYYVVRCIRENNCTIPWTSDPTPTTNNNAAAL